MDPILKYLGAKWRLADWIISHIPPHVGYVEPFFGSGAVFFNKEPSRLETISDLDGSIVRFFRVCRDHPKELARALALTPWSREEFLQSDFGETNPDDLEAARQFAVRCWMCFGSRLRCKTGWRHSTARVKNHGPNNPLMWSRLPDIVMLVGDRLLKAQIENRPALDVIRDNNGPEVLVYADPPYLMSTRSLHGDQYRNEMTDTEHEELLKALKQHKGMVLLSGYDCELYHDSLIGWHMDSIRSKAERGVTRTECLWSNPAATEHMAQTRLGV
jgi:DNA adenine methylase